jgi:hypothetical protein
MFCARRALVMEEHIAAWQQQMTREITKLRGGRAGDP